MMLVTNYPPSSSVLATFICPISFLQVENSVIGNTGIGKTSLGYYLLYHSESILEFASDYVAEGVITDSQRLTSKRYILEFVKSSVDVYEYSTLRGVIFERLSHRKLLNGGNFKYRVLDETNERGTYIIPNGKIIVQQYQCNQS